MPAEAMRVAYGTVADHDHHETPTWHPEARPRLLAVEAGVRNAGLGDLLVPIAARDASDEELARAHALTYVHDLVAMADAGGRRKPYVFAFQLLLFAGCAALWWAYPHRPDLARSISWAVVVATVGAEMSIVFNNAQLPDIVRPERMGRLSGFGWGLGYVGGLIALGGVLAVQFSRGNDPTYALERLTGPASSLWLLVFVLPMFLFSGTFYSLSVYPRWLQIVVECLPLQHGIELLRDLNAGEFDWGLVGHASYFVGMAAVGLTVTARRLERLLLR